MGLTAAHECQKNGFEVDVIELNDQPGGMASHFDLGDTSIEKFYHFICTSDYHTFDLLNELDLGSSLCWANTKMGYFINGKLYSWGDPISLLKFPLLNLWEKFIYGFLMFRLTKAKSFEKIEFIDAKSWLQKDIRYKDL